MKKEEFIDNFSVLIMRARLVATNNRLVELDLIKGDILSYSFSEKFDLEAWKKSAENLRVSLKNKVGKLSLNKNKAYQLMLLGFKITHEGFKDNQYLSWNECKLLICTEKGTITAEQFFDSSYFPEASWQVKF